MTENETPSSRGSIPTGWPLVVLMIHSAAVFAVGCALFVSKWFPYGPLAHVREWLYRFF